MLSNYSIMNRYVLIFLALSVLTAGTVATLQLFPPDTELSEANFESGNTLQLQEGRIIQVQPSEPINFSVDISSTRPSLKRVQVVARSSGTVVEEKSRLSLANGESFSINSTGDEVTVDILINGDTERTQTIFVTDQPEDCNIFSGDGTESSPYKVTNATQLDCIDEGNYVLTNNIDTRQYSIHSYGGLRLTDTFDGTLDGNGYSIVEPATEGSLIGTNNGVVKNLTVQNGAFTETNGGSLASRNDGTITDIDFTGSVTGDDRIGGLVGVNSGTVENIRMLGNHPTVTATAFTNDSRIVDGGNWAGGVVGRSTFGSIVRNITFSSSEITPVIFGANFDNISTGAVVGKLERGAVLEEYRTIDCVECRDKYEDMSRNVAVGVDDS